jgi:CRP-like cAMP-binding protein
MSDSSNIGRYLAATLEDVKITQADICKVTGLTGVTLRKVYKELLSNVEQLLPKNYVPPNMGLLKEIMLIC